MTTDHHVALLSDFNNPANNKNKPVSEGKLHSGNTLKQFILFSSIGVIGTTGHYLTLIILVELAGLNPEYATTAGFTVGALINYILNYRITFRSNKRHREALTKFLVIALAGAVINYLIMRLGLVYSSLHYLFVQIFATGCVLVWNFILNKFWTFRA